MLDVSPEKLLVVGFIAFVVLGPSRLPEVARTLGRFVAQLRRTSSGFQTEVRSALSEPTEAIQSALGDWRPPTNIRRAVRDTLTSTLIPPTAADVTGTAGAANGADAGGAGTRGAATANGADAGGGVASGAGVTNGAGAVDGSEPPDRARPGGGPRVDADHGAWGDPSPLPDDPGLN